MNSSKHGFLDVIPVGVASLDDAGLIVWANASFEELLGFCVRELLGASIFGLVHEGDRADLAEVIRGFGGAPPPLQRHVGELRFRSRSGATVWGDIRLACDPSFAALAPGLTSCFMTIQDVSAWKTLERDLRESREELSAVYNNTYDAIFVHDMSGSILDLNDQALRMYGISRDEAQSLRIDDLSAPESPMDELPGTWNRVSRGESALFEWLAMKPHTRAVFDVEVYLNKISLHGKPVIIANVRDTSDRKSAEREKAALMEERELYLQTISHDLRTPLAVISTSATVLQDSLSEKRLDDGLRHPVAAIYRSAMRMNTMIQDLLDTARIERGRLELDTEPVGLASFLEDLLDRSSVVIDTARIRSEIPHDLPPLIADPDRLERIILNLLTNALKFSPSDRPVLLKGSVRGRHVRISVQDEGVGMDSETLSHVFERFFRGKGSSKGLGLGLHIAKVLVEAHGGSISAESQPGQGSVFHVHLPSLDDGRPTASSTPADGPPTRSEPPEDRR